MSRPARFPLRFPLACIAACTLALSPLPARAAPVTSIHELAQQEKAPLLDTLRDLVNIESGSKDSEGLAQLAALIAERLTRLGGKVEIIEPTEIYRMDDTPPKPGSMVHAVFKGTGTRKIMLIAHMDTVYLKGMLKDQPFRIDGDRAYGLAVGDDKQGIALILHAVAMLQKLKFTDYGMLTVLINGDEEISSPGSRSTITRMAGEHDAVFSYEGGGMDGNLRLATSGIGAAYLTVDGKASHAGAAPEKGVNALYELSHQMLQLSNLSRREQGLSLNWTVSQSGTNRNVIPAQATAQGDARALKVSDFAELEATLQQRIKTQRIPDAKVQLRFEMRRPPLEATPASRRLAAHGTAIYEELGLPLKVIDVASGGGTDAAFAALMTKAPVIEGFGLSGFGAHSNDAEYVKLETIVPRLYLSARMIMDVSQDKVK
ncbi:MULTISPECIES: M20/M25/M40 family metallo-hydrolase [unclassified Bradyrhizobium]|uniref:M20/M25/M40 family metallo-hydrolase n=1 Tax=unclassified Bradyrhizobium TaxID=2631580 RepID=UPI001BAB0384|nr:MULTISPECIES: M20/M25/M40 family metallo-hydrolase [unclassified Bradyrhizobium]MBR1228337.1 M20/M25/M40 family metallo-hydrolase [Bradyrhizobium sp. AUGA SZCCT0176]MBR1299394.1 M20/M25/M40 family metallo-hydrolase [Bradyrhizobium sp. AUGA SZCCT0042]